MDGDCIPTVHFIDHHKQLAQKKHFVTGNRILLNPALTKEALAQQLPIYQWHFFQWFAARVQGKCNRVLPFVSWMRFLCPQYVNKWEGAKTCNLALWREDFVAINGFDESYQGWGYEDSDLVIRLMRAGISRKNSRFWIPVIHLWHAENDRALTSENLVRLKKNIPR